MINLRFDLLKIGLDNGGRYKLTDNFEPKVQTYTINPDKRERYIYFDVLCSNLLINNIKHNTESNSISEKIYTLIGD